MDKITGLTTIISLFFCFNVTGILYVYLGYPLLIALLARLKPQAHYLPAKDISVSLIIAAYNEEKVIEEKIENSLALDYPASLLQVIIAADGSNDSTPQLTKKYAHRGVDLVYQPQRRGKTAALNRAVQHARGEVLVFSDANNTYPADTLRHLIAPFADPQVGATSGIKRIQEGDGALGSSEGLYWKYESFIKKQESRLGSCTSASGEILAVRKSAYIPPPDNYILDDFNIAMGVLRQGYRFLYTPNALSIERVSPTAQDEVIRRTKIISGRYQAMFLSSKILPFNQPILVWQIVSHKFMRLAIPFFMIGALLFNLIALLLPRSASPLTLSAPTGELLLLLQIIFYVAAFLGAKLPQTGKPHKLIRLIYLPTFLVNSNLASFRGFLQFLRGNSTPLWERVQRR